MPPTPATDRPAAVASEHLVVPLRRRWLGPLLVIGLLLSLASVILQRAKGRGWEPPSLQLDRLLNLDEDLSAMNWLTASTFLLGGVVAYTVAAGEQVRRLGWFATAGALTFVSLDEATGAHDPISVKAEAQLRAGGWRAAVVLLGAVLLGAVVAAFVLRLPAPVRWRVAGALGMLLVAAVGIDAAGPDLTSDPAARLEAGYVAKATLEEILELGAAVLVLDGMLMAALTR